MVRDELYITVPNLFRCPISMDVMRSPVSLCTGVTYDRSSIQHWLDSGHDTCPATMQTLRSKDFVPNLTLRRLINLWAQSNGPPSPASSPSVSYQKATTLVRDIENNGNENLPNTLSEVLDLIAAGDENRRFLAGFDGFVSAIVGVLSRGGAKMEVLELSIRVLDSILTENGVGEKLNSSISKRNYDCLPSICLVIQKGIGSSSKIESVRVLESIAVNAESKRAITENQDLFHALLDLLASEKDDDLNDAVFSFFIAISVTHSAKAELVRSGIVQLVSKSLSDPKTKICTKEKGLKLMSIMSTCAEGRSAMRDWPECAKAVAEKLMKVSRTANEDAVAVLWSLCCLLGDKKAQEVVVRSNGVAKILLVMQSGYYEGHKVRRICGDLVKVLSAGCRAGVLGLGLYDSKTTHIMPC
ncbi:U-box domain-containing protein 28 [Ziziphus jujuba]|uniref:U-box domain-containing protein n=1 Tax=Ziziphus jujuba TaxID=326968 RepID=A0A6P4BU00_ZIZJJ|nr:U-box domain-containing protein 28 [Ziziphus jujuba]